MLPAQSWHNKRHQRNKDLKTDMELIFLAELIMSDATLLIELCRISFEFMLLRCFDTVFRGPYRYF